MPTRLAERAPYWTRHNPAATRAMGAHLVLGCSDDRWPWGGIQFLGGNVGLAMVWGAGMELHRQDGFQNAATGLARPVHALAGAIHNILKTAGGVLGVNHEGCAGFMFMRQIALTGVEYEGRPKGSSRTVAAERAEALAIAQVTSEITEERFDRASEMLAKIALTHVAPTEVAEREMLPTGDRKWIKTDDGVLVPTPDGIPRVPLYLPKHEATVVAVNDDPYHVFSSLEAWEAGAHAYHVSQGHLPKIHGAVEPYLGTHVTLPELKDALTVFTAKTVLNLPMPGGQPGETLGAENVQYLPHVEALSGV